MAAPDLATEVSGAGSFPSQRFSQRERKLLESVKTYVDSLSPDTVITTQGDIIIGNASGNATRLAKGATNTVLVAGASTVSYASIVNANIDAAAAIADTKLATISTAGKVSGTAITSGNISTSGSITTTNAAGFVVNTATHDATLQTDGSGVQLDSTGNMLLRTNGTTTAVTISTGQVTTLAQPPVVSTFGTAGVVHNNSSGVFSSSLVALADLATGITPSHVVKFAGTFTTVGGDANETITVTGATATDIAIVVLHTKGAVPRTILTAQAATDAINLEFSGDPSNDHIVRYMVIRAAS